SPRRTAYADNPLLQARQPLLQPQAVAATDPSSLAAQSGPRMVVLPPPNMPVAGRPTAVAAAPPLIPATPNYTAPTADAGARPDPAGRAGGAGSRTAARDPSRRPHGRGQVRPRGRLRLAPGRARPPLPRLPGTPLPGAVGGRRLRRQGAAGGRPAAGRVP